MGVCSSRQEIVLSDKEQVEFMNQIKVLLSDMDSYINQLKEQEVNYKMSRMIFILNCIKEINPFIEIMETGRKCDPAIKDLIVFILNSVKENDRKKYNSGIFELKKAFNETK